MNQAAQTNEAAHATQTAIAVPQPFPLLVGGFAVIGTSLAPENAGQVVALLESFGDTWLVKPLKALVQAGTNVLSDSPIRVQKDRLIGVDMSPVLELVSSFAASVGDVASNAIHMQGLVEAQEMKRAYYASLSANPQIYAIPDLAVVKCPVDCQCRAKAADA